MTDSRPVPTERFERVIAFAADEADGLGHAFIDNRHLFYALAAEGRGLARATLDKVGITAQTIHDILAQPSVVHDRITGQLEIAGELRETLQRAGDIAQKWQQRTLDTEHLLYGSLIKPSSLDEILNTLGLKPNIILSKLYELQRSAPPAAEKENGSRSYRLTLESSWVLGTASQLAVEAGSHAIDSKHLLLALVQRDRRLSEIFNKSFQLTFELMQPLIFGQSHVERTTANIKLTDEVQRILGYAIGEAWNRGHHTTQPRHIALALVRTTGCSALNFLADLGVSQADLFDELEPLVKSSQ